MTEAGSRTRNCTDFSCELLLQPKQSACSIHSMTIDKSPLPRGRRARWTRQNFQRKLAMPARGVTQEEMRRAPDH